VKPLRDVLAAAAIGGLATLIVLATPAAPWLGGLSADLLFLARHATGLEPEPASPSPAVVIAIDEETYRRPPFEGLPKVAWTPLLGEAIAAALDGGAAVVGQDLILPTSLESLVPGNDRPYLAALARGAAEGRMVLGAVRHQGERIGPHPAHRMLARGEKNVRLLNLLTDADGVIRRAPVVFGAPDRTETAFAAELVGRALGVRPEIADNHLILGPNRLPLDPEGGLLLDFRANPRAVPVHSLADVLACARAGRTGHLEQAFAGRVVLIGSMLDLEDRKVTAARYLGRRDGDGFTDRCVHPVMTSVYGDAVARQTIPGVMVHARAVNDMIAGSALRALPPWGAGALVFAFGFLTALLVLKAPAVPAAAGGVALLLLAALGALWAFTAGVVTPWLSAEAALLLAGGSGYGYRFAVTDRDKRHLRRTFARYLSPEVVEELAASGRAPELGGETREVTVWFSDLASFTKMSEAMSPEELVEALNAYLSIVTETIVGHRGMIDKYIGDAVVGVFGAPLDDPDHAGNAVDAARECQARLAAFAEERSRSGRPWPHTRLGLNTGPALVGNIGSAQRFDYTVMGDAVNLAARLESLNKRYGSTVLMSGATARASGATDLRLIDRVQVVGRSEPTDIFGPAIGLSEAHLTAFEAAREALENGRFALAAEGFSALTETDPVAARMADHAAALAADPPGDWSRITILDTK
jgi:class 3 adenylate cyclase/CHASE2 domain-containing sensor protein